ncbi:MAG: alanine dehydrogenase [Bdellovibrionota bacterium]
MKPTRLSIGVPKEIKVHEGRVGLTPEGVRHLVRLGATVWIEHHAGEKSGLPDAEYRRAGAKLASAAEVWRRAGLIVKVKEPVGPERNRLREGQALFCYLHLAPDPALVRVLLKKKVTAIDYEHVELSDGSTPLLFPMSDIAGRLCIVLGSYYVACHPAGSGVLLGVGGGLPGGEVVVLGAGTVGRAAAEEAVAIGAKVTVLDISEKSLARVRRMFGKKVRTLRATSAAITRAVRDADLLVGAVYHHGESSPKLVTERMVRSMKKGSLIMDVSIDQGGCVGTSRPTTHDDPVFVRHGVLHYAVTNMPGTVPKTSTRALTSRTLLYVEKLARYGVEGALRRFPEIARALNTRDGRLIHPGVRRSLPQFA